MTVVGAYEAKTHLPKLLDRVEAGEEIVITRHGREVARLVPASARATRNDLKTIIARWREVRRGVTLGGLKVKDLIEEGRRW